ncbi:hypothetical protein MGYG_08968 [Nannizzia gypsea CBS 118893]|uniref:Uncharacterized protein n=1 Tax=Arthroderma gypseum (strain ATCC MYA-4604 / CBS 118893) TaxID=535722 RepID=E4UQY0_ARTGP|nr:hypothetical protein MGYG_08968 [Nannizzia gypsea CBS 118893]EFQ99306.1 hypothetical protein MGYG_08968 [Nannizzia gypsea CBS 118893]
MPSFPFKHQGKNGQHARAGPIKHDWSPATTQLVQGIMPVQTRHNLFNEPPNRLHHFGPRTQVHMAAHQLARPPEVPPHRAVAGSHRWHQSPPFIPMHTTTHPRVPPLQLDNMPASLPIAVRRRREGRHQPEPRLRHLRRRRHHDASDTHTDADRTSTIHESEWSTDDESLLGVPSFLKEAHDRRHRRKKGQRRDRSKDRDIQGSSDESVFFLDDDYDEAYLSDRRWDDSRSFVRRRPEDMYWWHPQRH